MNRLESLAEQITTQLPLQAQGIEAVGTAVAILEFNSIQAR